MKPKQSNQARRMIPIYTRNETLCFQPEKVTHLECTGCLSTIYCANGKILTAIKTLKSFEAILSEHGFMRVHHNAIVNIHHIEKISRNGKYILELSDGEQVVVSRRKAKELREFLGYL
jgi:two-component system, LytTR family, response regulator